MELAFYLLLAITAFYAFFLLLEVIFPGLPIALVRFHANSRKIILPILWMLGLTLVLFSASNIWPLFLLQTVLSVIGIALHQDIAFRAVSSPSMVGPAKSLLQSHDTVIAVTYNNKTRVYPLNYIAHHHIVNDTIQDIHIAITFCPMCHMAMVYNTSDIGPLYVATLHKGNLVLADYKTKTYFQQATGEYLAGPLQNKNLARYSFEQSSWDRIQTIHKDIVVVDASAKDLLPFDLPIPGLWKKVLNSNFVPTIHKNTIDKRLPAREMVVGINFFQVNIAFKKSDVIKKQIVINEQYELLLVAFGDNVEAYHFPKGKTYSGNEEELQALRKVPTSTEYWFSWSQFNPMTQLIEV